MGLNTCWGRALRRSHWRPYHIRTSPPNPTLWKYWQLLIPPVMDWDTFPCTYSPGPFHCHSGFLLFRPTLHKGSFTHHWQNYKIHIPCFLASLLDPFPTCTSSLFPFCHYALALINRCLFGSELWFARLSPLSGPFWSLWFCSSPRNVISLGKRKKKKGQENLPLHIKIHSFTSNFSFP